MLTDIPLAYRLAWCFLGLLVVAAFVFRIGEPRRDSEGA